jgi:ribosomal protein S18 acetylase RimI-like enzyme
MQPDIVPAHDLSLAEIERLEAGLYEFNRDATGRDDGRGLGFVARGPDGRMLGAVNGHTWAGAAEIGQLWVEPQSRGQGLGLALLDAAIAEAANRGCSQAFVMTHDFQAPGLYEKRGFERIAEVDDWPEGHSHILLRKRLNPFDSKARFSDQAIPPDPIVL